MKQNKDILNQIHATASAEYQGRVAVATAENGAEIYTTIMDFPSLKNEFINALTNKVVKSVFYSKVFSNPLQMLHRGKLPFGASVEQIFVDMAERKNFDERFTGSMSVEGDLIRKAEPGVNVRYITKNFAYKYKVSISETQLRAAFASQTGLSELVNQLTNSAISSAYYDEFSDMKAILLNLAAGQDFKGTPLVDALPVATVSVPTYATNPADLAEKVRALSGRLTFPSPSYNMAGVKTWSNKEDLVLFTTPEINAKLDVSVLANAFNVSSADVQVRIILIDELPTVGGKETLAILADKDLIQAYDTILETRTFENADQLMTNMFLHKQGIMAECLFANAVYITA